MIKTYELKHIRNLRNIAKDLNHGLKSKHAAMLTVGNKIVSMGVNKAKSCPFQKQNSKTHKQTNPFLEYSFIHAEVDCLKGLEIDFKRATLYVVRTDSTGKLMESCPCQGCNSLINKLKIPRLVYSVADGTIVENNITYHKD